MNTPETVVSSVQWVLYLRPNRMHRHFFYINAHVHIIWIVLHVHNSARRPEIVRLQAKLVSSCSPHVTAWMIYFARHHTCIICNSKWSVLWSDRCICKSSYSKNKLHLFILFIVRRTALNCTWNVYHSDVAKTAVEYFTRTDVQLNPINLMKI